MELFKNITWPQLTPAVNTNFLLNIVGSLQAWMLFLVLTGYKNGTQVLGYVVYAEAFGQTGTSVVPPGIRSSRLDRAVPARAGSSEWQPTASSAARKEVPRMTHHRTRHRADVGIDRSAPAPALASRTRTKIASYTILVLFALVYVGPLVMLIFASMKSLPEFFQNPTGFPEGFTLDNFTEAWNLANFPRLLGQLSDLHDRRRRHHW